jgi:hypothetical protein
MHSALVEIESAVGKGTVNSSHANSTPLCQVEVPSGRLFRRGLGTYHTVCIIQMSRLYCLIFATTVLLEPVEYWHNHPLNLKSMFPLNLKSRFPLNLKSRFPLNLKSRFPHCKWLPLVQEDGFVYQFAQENKSCTTV